MTYTEGRTPEAQNQRKFDTKSWLLPSQCGLRGAGKARPRAALSFYLPLSTDTAAAAATATLTTGHTELTLDDERFESRTDTFTSRYRLYTLRRGAGPVLRFLTDMPLLLSMALAQTPRTALGLARGEQRPQAASAEAEEQYGYGLPPRMRWPMRLYYEPLWALLVRTSQKWKPWAWA